MNQRFDSPQRAGPQSARPALASPPALAPAAAFFARGLAFADERWQRWLLALSTVAALAATLLFTNRLTFTTAPLSGQPWNPIIEAYPSSHMTDAREFFEPRAR